MTSDLDPRPAGGCLKGCAFGCLGVVVLVVVVAVMTARTVVSPFHEAIDSREQLEARFGGQEGYTPAIDGTVGADRIEAFLEVRTALAPACSEFSELSAQFQAMEELADRGEEPSKVEAMGQAMETTRAAFRMAPLMGGFFATRNQTLLESGMGLGEYTYIFTIAYGDRFNETGDDPLFGRNPLNERVRNLVIAMLERQRDLAVAADPASAERVAAELEALRADSARVPWQDGLPEAVAVDLEPYRAALDEAFCPVTAGIDLLKNKEQSFRIEAE